MIAAAVRKLCRSDVDDTLSCTVRYLMNEAEDILIGISEAHSSADTALEI